MSIEIRNMKRLFGMREPLSGLSHFVGFILALFGLAWLIHNDWNGNNTTRLVADVIFGISLVALYLSSTLYHALPVGPVGIIRLKRLDHMMIFVLIAGTYTPICLVAIGGTLGWASVIGIWSLAALGIACKIFWLGMPRWGYVAIYLIMGWLGVFLMPTLARSEQHTMLFWLAVGGACYSIGAVIYALKWPNFFRGVWEFHETWHLFVLGGSICHFLAVQG